MKSSKRQGVAAHFFARHVWIQSVPHRCTLCGYRTQTREDFEKHVHGYSRHTEFQSPDLEAETIFVTSESPYELKPEDIVIVVMEEEDERKVKERKVEERKVEEQKIEERKVEKREEKVSDTEGETRAVEMREAVEKKTTAWILEEEVNFDPVYDDVELEEEHTMDEKGKLEKLRKKREK
jgi:hypothetical protein